MKSLPMRVRSDCCTRALIAVLLGAGVVGLAHAQTQPDATTVAINESRTEPTPSALSQSYYEQQQRLSELEQRQEHMRRQMDLLRAEMEFKRTLTEYERITGAGGPGLYVVAVATFSQGALALLRDTSGVQRWVREGDEVNGWVISRIRSHSVQAQNKKGAKSSQSKGGKTVTLPIWVPPPEMGALTSGTMPAVGSPPVLPPTVPPPMALPPLPDAVGIPRPR